MATIPAGQKTCLRAPAGQTKTLLRGKSDFPRSKPPLSSEESQSPRFRAFQAWCKRNTMYLIFIYKSPIYNLGPGPRISTLDLAPGDKDFNFGPDPRWHNSHWHTCLLFAKLPLLLMRSY